jgi:hypothetical protein
MTPAALNRDQAAEFVGLSPNSFDKLVASGRMPKGRTYAPDVERIVWLCEELLTALKKLPTHGVKTRPYEGVEL